ncbi:hypothetical protein ACMYYO_11230 [Dermacoccaceae bacterium W4C1]
MRWQELFADLESQLRHAETREQAIEVADRTRAERAAVSWLDRAARAVGAELEVETGTGRVAGRLVDLGRDWMLLSETAGHGGVMIPVSAVSGVRGLPEGSDSDVGLGRRFGLGVALRAISRDRAAVSVQRTGGPPLVGTIDVVGADYLELAEHPADLPRRPHSVTAVRVIPFEAIAALRRIAG